MRWQFFQFTGNFRTDGSIYMILGEYYFPFKTLIFILVFVSIP